jgi:hypothetical protein
MSLPALDNLVRIGQLKAEPRNVLEATRMLEMARTRLADAQLTRLSLEGRFTSAYNAAHAAALAALRWHGYRSENRYMVFQCLAHTVNWPANRWRVIDAAHQKRNLAEYEGYLDVEESTVAELCILVPLLIDDVQTMIAGTTDSIPDLLP